MINPIYSIYFLALNSGLYSGFSKFALSMWLRDSGADLMLLNLFSWTMFPSVFSAFWLPFLENFDILRFKFGIKKNLIIFCDFFIVIMTIGLQFFSIQNLTVVSKVLLIFFLIVYSSVISTRDSISIGYKMEFISKEKLSEYDGIISAFYQAGMLITTAGLLKLSVFFSWNFIFFVMFSYFLLNLFIDFLIENSSYIKQKKLNFIEKFSKPYKDLISNNRKVLISLLLFLIFFSLPDRMLAGNLNYYILDAGISKSVFADLKLITSFLGIFMGIITAYLTKNIGIKKMLIISATLYGLIPISIFLNFYFNIFGSYSSKLLIVLYILDKVIKVIQGTSFFTYQMQFCSKESASTQRALFVFLERGFCIAMAPIIGMSLNAYGYSFFFFLVSLFVIPSLISVLNLFRVTKNVTKKN